MLISNQTRVSTKVGLNQSNYHKLKMTYLAKNFIKLKTNKSNPPSYKTVEEH